jgi:hypothetical protein
MPEKRVEKTIEICFNTASKIGDKDMEHCNCGHQRRQHGTNLECKNCECKKFKAVGDKRKDRI